jgi:hypothetical protein
MCSQLLILKSLVYALTVTTPGFFFGGPGTNATTCPANTYNPGANRLTSCYACPSGLITTSNGSDSKLDCRKFLGGMGMMWEVVVPYLTEQRGHL